MTLCSDREDSDDGNYDATYAVEQHIILLSQARHEGVLRQIILSADILLVRSLCLLL